MKHFVRPFTLAVLSGAVLAFAACSKDDNEPQAGTIAGQITPVDAITTVTATPAAGTATTATPTAVGAYSLGGLAAGTYTVTYTPAAGYLAPAAQTATVTAGATTTLPATTVAAAPGTVSFTINGAAVAGAMATGAATSNGLTIAGGSPAGAVFFAIGNVTGPGAYPINTGTCSLGTTAYIIDSGTVQVTSYNATTRRISGTFSISASQLLGPGTATVTNGTFTNVTLQ